MREFRDSGERRANDSAFAFCFVLPLQATTVEERGGRGQAGAGEGSSLFLPITFVEVDMVFFTISNECDRYFAVAKKKQESQCHCTRQQLLQQPNNKTPKSYR